MKRNETLAVTRIRRVGLLSHSEGHITHGLLHASKQTHSLGTISKDSREEDGRILLPQLIVLLVAVQSVILRLTQRNTADLEEKESHEARSHERSRRGDNAAGQASTQAQSRLDRFCSEKACSCRRHACPECDIAKVIGVSATGSQLVTHLGQ